MINKYTKYYFIASLALFLGLVVFLIESYYDFIWIDHHVHSALEGMGGLSAFVMSFFLLQRRNEKFSRYYVVLAAGFLSLGLFDIAHSITDLGNNFVFLRSISDLVGGSVFLLLWLPWISKLDNSKTKKIFFSIILLFGIVISVIAIGFNQILPAMLAVGKFTNVASSINLLSSTFFIASAIKLFLIYNDSLEFEFFLFGSVIYFFSFAGVLFPVSEPWCGTWWLWHLLRAASYLLLLTIAIRAYSQKNESLFKTLLEKTSLQNDLKQSEEKHRAIFESSLDAFIIANLGGQIIDVNPAACLLYGYTKEEMTGKIASELIHPDYHNIFDEFKTKLQMEGSFSGETIDVGKDGKLINTEVKGSLINIDNEMHLLAVVRDITESKRVQQELLYKEKRFRVLFENEPDAILLAEAESGILVDANPAAEELLKRSKDEIVGMHQSQVHPDDIAEELAERFKEGVKKTSDLVVSEIITSNKERVPVEIAAVTVELDEKIYFLGIFRNITDRFEAENKIKDALSFNENIFNESPVGKIVYDNYGKTLIVNKKTAEILNISEDDMMNTNMYNLQLWEENDLRNEMITVLKEEGIGRREIFVNLPNGKKRWLDCNFRSFNQKEEPHLLMAFSNITEIKEAEELMKEAIVKLEISNKELEQFAYVASHDLQEPLRMVSSYTQLLEKRYKDKLDDDAKEFIKYSVDGANRMQVLINDLLQFSRVATKGREFEMVDLSLILGQSIANLKRKIDNALAIITNDFLPELAVDQIQITEVFKNLIDNAIKFRSHSNPLIHISAIEKENEFLFSVKDNGMGIQKNYHSRIFEIFERLHTEEKYDGTGIGLAICKRIIERHGGRIWVESELGVGSTFYFTLKSNLRGS